MSKLIRDLMHPGIITCPPDASLGLVAVLLTNHRIHAIGVADPDGRILGILTDFDLLACEWLSTDPERLKTMQGLTAGELMTSPVNTIEAEARASEGALKILEAGIHRLMVVENGKPVGIVSIADFVKYMAQTAPESRKTVASVMSDALLVCRDKTPLRAAARAMTDTGWRSVLVVNPRGKPLGVVTGMDMLSFWDTEGATIDREQKTVADVMKPALTIHMDASLREAADQMIANHDHRLLVIDPDDPDTIPLGLLSSYDIVAEMTRPGSGWR